MNPFSKIVSFFGGGVIKETGTVLDNLFTSDEERLNAKNIYAKIKQKPQSAQWEINKIEAQTGNSWRTLTGKIAAVSMGLYFIPQYIIAALLWAHLCWSLEPVNGVYVLPSYPVNAETIMKLIFGMLGLGGIKGVEIIAQKAIGKIGGRDK
jgi:hypothetical protein